MATKTPQTPQARAARDALLKRAEWIVNANVQAACGYTPELPPDLMTFDLERTGDPDGRALAALLKGVMPIMQLKDDRAPGTIPPSGPPLERCQWYVDRFHKGAYSRTEVDDLVKLEWGMMEATDRQVLVEYIKAAQLKAAR